MSLPTPICICQAEEPGIPPFYMATLRVACEAHGPACAIADCQKAAVEVYGGARPAWCAMHAAWLRLLANPRYRTETPPEPGALL